MPMIRTIGLVCFIVWLATNTSSAQEQTRLAEAYAPNIKPLLTRYCQECHSEEVAEAEINLQTFDTWQQVRKHPQVWQKVGEMLESGQMPPKDSKQPTDDERKALRDWVRSYLTFEAAAHAGDPGRVVLRRLSNAEYTYTLRDLTGISALDPAREFPVDGAAGEGFTNTGNALVMSPALVTKYLDAAKDVADHAVLTPDGFRFSTYKTQSDWTNELLDRIRALYARYTDGSGGDKVNLQGIIFDTNQGGRLPLERYLTAIIEERSAAKDGTKSIEQIANARNLSPKYLTILWKALEAKDSSLLLDPVRARMRDAKPADVPEITNQVIAWQKSLFKFSSVGQLGKVGGPNRWMEPVEPIVTQQEVRLAMPPTSDSGEVVISLVSSEVGNRDDKHSIEWSQPRFFKAGQPELLLKDIRAMAGSLLAQRTQIFSRTAKCLQAVDDFTASPDSKLEEIAAKHGVESRELSAWLSYLGLGAGEVELRGHFTDKLTKTSDYDFIQGWGKAETPVALANSSDRHVRIPGNANPHSIMVHPAPTLRTAAGWQSPISDNVRIEGAVAHAHPECGNGVTWALELRRGSSRQRLASGIAQGDKPVAVGPIEKLNILKGDLLSLLIGPRDGNHSCDLTQIDLKIVSLSDDKKSWGLAADVSPDILAGNPHADRLGNKGVWHFYTEPDKAGEETKQPIPADSLLSNWLSAKNADEKSKAASKLQELLENGPAKDDAPNTSLYKQLASLGGPLLSSLPSQPANASLANAWGIDPASFGKLPDGGNVDAGNLGALASGVMSFKVPADLVAGREFIATARLSPGSRGTVVQTHIQLGKAEPAKSLRGDLPLLVSNDDRTKAAIHADLAAFRDLFPSALCYTKIVPVDEVVTLTLYVREDDHLSRLMLSDAEHAELDRMWSELRFVSQDAIKLVDVLDQLIQYATQDADPKIFEPLRGPYAERAAAFRASLIAAEPAQLAALFKFAERAYRRPMTAAESQELRSLYANLRKQELPHDDAFRLTLARLFVSPAFLYKAERPAAGAGQGPVSNFELANRLSYFLWSSQPDDELYQLAASGEIKKPEVIVSQMQRMLRDEKARRLAIQFGCAWLHVNDFDHLDEKSERHFPTFLAMRGPMYEESILFFQELFKENRSALEIVNADFTYLNNELANHYGIPGIEGPQWRKVEGVSKFARGGILALGSTLAMQSGASRTSPILRGNWVSETLLGERLPRPPKGVPQLPDDETATEGLTVRQLVEKHSSDEKCSICHARIDPFGFALEGFDAIGRRREKDLGDRAIDVRTKTKDGVELEGIEGLRSYLLTTRRDAFLRQFCKKLLGYSLGRAVQLSDEQLLTDMQAKLKANDYKIQTAFESVVLSKQFREIRGKDWAEEE